MTVLPVSANTPPPPEDSKTEKNVKTSSPDQNRHNTVTVGNRNCLEDIFSYKVSYISVTKDCLVLYI